MEPAAFEHWLGAAGRGAAAPATPDAARGQELFGSRLRRLPYACAAPRPTGTIGPDLTHLGGRATLGAGILPNERRRASSRWIAGPETIKPGVAHARRSALLPAEDVDAIAAYLEGLE